MTDITFTRARLTYFIRMSRKKVHCSHTWLWPADNHPVNGKKCAYALALSLHANIIAVVAIEFH